MALYSGSMALRKTVSSPESMTIARYPGLPLLDQIEQHLDKDEGCLGRLAAGAGEVAKGGKICPINMGMPVDDVEGFGHGA